MPSSRKGQLLYQDYKVNKIGPNIQVQISQKTLQKENVIYHILVLL